MAEHVPIYTPGWREAIEIKHFAQEFKHGGLASIRNLQPFDQGPNA